MTGEKVQENQDNLGSYIKNLGNQELKVLLLKLKNEIKKEDVLWEQIKDILQILQEKDEKTLNDIIPYILKT